MAEANILTLEGKVKGTMKLPAAFSESPRADLILRAVNAENSYALQPQAHFPLAGMQTTASYYGAMHSYRSGRHMGNAIRPREKLGGGIQGKVKRIPSATKGKRAHPHVVEKVLVERMNRREYQKAMAGAISATAATPKTQTRLERPIILSNDFEALKRTAEMAALFSRLGLGEYANKGARAHARKGLRRSTKLKLRKRLALIVVSSKEAHAIKAARNMPGVDICDVKHLKVGLLAPGGAQGRLTIWSEGAMASLDKALGEFTLG